MLNSTLILKDSYTPNEFETPKDRDDFLEKVKSTSTFLEYYNDESNTSIKYELYKSIYSRFDFISIYLTYNGELIYNSLTDINIINSLKIATQVSVYRDKTFKGNIKSLVSYVFWKYILEVSGIIKSSDAQSKDGMEFWLRRVTEALNHTNYFVYKIDTYVDNILIPVTKKTWNKDKKYIWGKTSEFSNRYALISKTKLD